MSDYGLPSGLMQIIVDTGDAQAKLAVLQKAWGNGAAMITAAMPDPLLSPGRPPQPLRVVMHGE